MLHPIMAYAKNLAQAAALLMRLRAPRKFAGRAG
jgi:hypothetical protein